MRWKDVRAALDELLAAPAAEREARLAELARRDPAFGGELASLLEHDRALEHDTGFLTPPAGPGSASGSAPAGDAGDVGDALPAGSRIGPWELVRELGRGGMGVVYLARRADGAYERQVALKLIGRGLGGAHLLERFRRERQVLAHLEHRGIARLLDGGSTADGTPYLVMEHVEGLPIDRACDERRLCVRARLELFLAVCDAVQHAHEHLVVHRDLKPSNILVGADGEPRLLDFGIAKVLDPATGSAGPEATIGVLRFLTPSYASPEQVAGGVITTASDVYSLGVVLFQLLTGTLPYRIESTSAAEIERIVCGTEAGRPSDAARGPGEAAEERARARGTGARELARALAGDLDRIVLQTLRKEPAQRYASVAALAEDLRRHLAGLPVSAQADTFRYRGSKFVRRHRVPVAAAAAVLVALVAGLVTTLVQYRRAEDFGAAEHEQRELAEDRLVVSEHLARDLDAERAGAVERLAEVERLNRALEAERALAERRFEDVHSFATKLIFDLHGVLYPIAGATRAVELVVSTGLEYLDRLAEEAGDDETLQRELAHAYLRMAEVQGGLGIANLGRLEQATVSVEKAVTIGQALWRSAPEDLRSGYTYALALCERGNLRRQAGDEGRALEDYRLAVEVGRVIESRPEANYGELVSVVVGRGLLAQLLELRVPPTEALDLYHDIEAPLERLIELHPEPSWFAERELVRAKIGLLEHGLGDPGAFERMARALEALEALGAEHPEDAIIGRKVRYVRDLLVTILGAEGGGGGAEWARELLEKSAAELDQVLAKDATDFQAEMDRVDVARGLMRLARDAGDPRAALALGEAELARARRLVAQAPTHALAIVVLGSLLADLGECQALLTLPSEAEEHLGEACERLAAVLARSPELVMARQERKRAEASLARLLCSSAEGEPDPERARLRFREASERFELALADIEALVTLGTPALDPDRARLRAELAESRARAASMGGG